MKSFYRFIITNLLLLFFSGLLFGQDTIHIVQKGETLYSISRKYNVTVAEISDTNKLGSKTTVYVGQKLIIPVKTDSSKTTTESSTVKTEINKTQNYVVKSGDTLYSIAKNNGITVDELRKINSLTSSSVLKVGQKLLIPSTELNISNVVIPVVADPRSYDKKKTGDISLVWPVSAVEVAYVTGKISGVAITAEKQDNVTAIKSGTVMFSGIYRGFGQVVFIQSDTGHIYVYTGLSSLLVNKGEYVSYGQKVGIIGIDTISNKPQLNLMVFKDGNPMDPAKAPRG
jgi:murein DD-endopeptidase MepM/ murein hydrolase activator NlpD